MSLLAAEEGRGNEAEAKNRCGEVRGRTGRSTVDQSTSARSSGSSAGNGQAGSRNGLPSWGRHSSWANIECSAQPWATRTEQG